MSVYELATLTFAVGTKPDRLEGLPAYLAQDQGELVGVFNSEISRQNLTLVIRRFETLSLLAEARQRALLSPAPFGCDGRLLAFSAEAHAPFPGFEEAPRGPLGPCYEFRSYKVPPGGIGPTLLAWTAILPARSRISKPPLIMYALDGPPRFVHIWAYTSLAQREQLRTQALEQGVWPPSSAPKWLTTEMSSEIFVPDRLSPLT
jgi:hypothetical protein